MMPPSWEPRTMRSGSPSAAISSSMAMFTAGPLFFLRPDAQSEAGSGLAPLTASTVSPTEMDPSPALVHRSSRPSSSSL